MKNQFYLLLGVFLLSLSSLKAQDLIVKTNKDSINCKIIKQNASTIFYYTYTNKKEVLNSIQSVEVSIIKFNYFDKPALDTTSSIANNQNTINTTYKNKERNILSGVRLGMNYSAAYLFTKIPDGLNYDEREYRNGLKSGVGYLFSFNYYLKKYGGLGVQIMNFYSSGSLDNVSVITSPGQTTKITISDNISIQYIGFSYGYSTAISQNKKWFVTGDIGLGYNTYQNTAIALEKQKITATTLGINTQVGFDYKIAENLYVGIVGNYILASVGTYEYDNGIEKKTVTLPNNAKDSYSRAQISIGMRFVIE